MRSPYTIIALIAALGMFACGDDTQTVDSGGIILPDGATCNSKSCGGCCSGNSCFIAQDNEHCGANGQACVACKNNEICYQGKCTAPGQCTPRNCTNGCCKNDKCQTGNTGAACGHGGTACVTCSSTQKCVNHACICDATTCSGCCYLGNCMSGTDAKYCGKGGAACVGCKATEGCVGGVCTPGASCSPSSCKGCCSGATCKTGDTTQFCGTGGTACAACKSGETCSKGTCNNPTTCGPSSCSGCCQGGKCLSGVSATACGTGGGVCQACGTKQTCQSGICKLDSNSKWGITVISAKIDTAKKWDWPLSTEPDPFVDLTVGSVQGKTTVKSNTYTPYWNELVLTTTAYGITKYGMTVKIYDDDLTGQEPMGSCSLSVSESVLVSGYGATTKCSLSGTLHVKELYFKFTSN